MKIILHTLVYIFLINACKTTGDSDKVDVSTKGFKIEGVTTGVKDGETIYLRNMKTFELMDTALINNNHFVFSGDLEIQPLKVELHMSDITQSKIFWIENTQVQFDASTLPFANAVIKGSPTNDSVTLLQQKMRNEGGGRLPHELKFIKENPGSVYSPYALSNNAILWEKELTQTLYDSLSTENKNSHYGKKVLSYLSLNQNIEIGSEFVDFTMPSVEGIEKSLSKELGKVTLLEFWASWCGPCRSENPNLVKIYKKYKDQGFNIVAVSLDHKKENWKQAISDDNLPWTHISDLNGDDNEAKIIYGVSGIPANFLIDENGKIIAEQLIGEQLEEAIISALKN